MAYLLCSFSVLFVFWLPFSILFPHRTFFPFSSKEGFYHSGFANFIEWHGVIDHSLLLYHVVFLSFDWTIYYTRSSDTHPGAVPSLPSPPVMGIYLKRSHLLDPTRIQATFQESCPLMTLVYRTSQISGRESSWTEYCSPPPDGSFRSRPPSVRFSTLPPLIALPQRRVFLSSLNFRNNRE